MQQIVQERLRQQNRLPVQPPARKPGQSPRGPLGTSVLYGPDMSRGVAPTGPGGARTPARPGGVTPAPADQRRQSALERYQQRYERHVEKKLGTPTTRPQPKPEAPREFRKVTLTEGITVEDLAEKLDVKFNEMIKKLMERGVFASKNQSLDREMAKDICERL